MESPSTFDRSYLEDETGPTTLIHFAPVINIELQKLDESDRHMILRMAKDIMEMHEKLEARFRDKTHRGC